MPVTFRIIPERGLVVVWYSGHATIDETLAATNAYISHPDYAAGQKQIIDLSQVQSFEKDYVRFMNMQASKAKRLAGSGVQSLAVYIAPTQISQEVSAMFVRSWAAVEAVVPLVQLTEADGLALLGQSEETIDELLAAVDEKTLQ